MVRRTTFLVVLALVVLVGFAFFFQRYQSNKAAGQPTTTPQATAAPLYNLGGAAVTDVLISSQAGDTIELFRDAGKANWAIKGLPPEQADALAIDNAITPLLSLQVLQTLSQSPALESVGLASPAYTITLTTADGQQVVTHVGSLNAVGTGYYVQVGSGPVMIADNVILDDVLKFLSSPPLVATPTPQASGTPNGTPLAPGLPSTPTP